MKTTLDYTELYSNKLGAIAQSDTHRCLTICFNGSKEILSLPCFLCLKKAVDKIDLEAMANNMEADVEILTSCGIDKCYILSLSEAYFFKDLLAGAKVMLELNSIIQQTLYCHSFC